MNHKIIRNVPNALTIFRILLIPFIVIYLYEQNYVAAMAFLIISCISDILDGCIARKFNIISDFGKLIDPLADKLTQLSVLITITITNLIPAWILAVILIKEVLMVCGASFLFGKDTVVSSKWYGKLSTVLLYAAILCSIFITYLNLDEIFIEYNNYLYYTALVSTIFSLVMYFRAFFNKSMFIKDK